jgi:hypothetical protein
MARTKPAKSALPYVQRLIEDQYVQEQLRDAATGLHAAYTRAALKRAQATDDKQLYASLRRAATSMRNAAMALRRQEPPPKHRVRNVSVIAFAVGLTVMLTRFAQKQTSDASPQPVSPVGDGNEPAVSGAVPPAA